MAIKLYYFNLRGRAELIRLILHAAHVPFEDIRLTHEQWLELKPKMPMNQVPVLDYNGDLLPESISIARFLAFKYNLASHGSVNKERADAVVQGMQPYVEKLITFMDHIFIIGDTTKKAAEDPVRADVPKFLELMSKFMRLYGSNGHFVGKSLTWADLAFFTAVEMFEVILPQVDLMQYPELQKCMNIVRSTEEVKEYLDTRPKTAF